MSSEALVSLLNFHGAPVRMVMRDGEPIWIGKDACEVLGLSKYRDVLAKLDDDERVSTSVDTPGGKQEMVGITEPGIYKLIARCDKPQAKPFMRWLTHEVIPSIRRTGAYVTPAATAPVIDIPTWAQTILAALAGKTQAIEAIAEEARAIAHAQQGQLDHLTAEVADRDIDLRHRLDCDLKALRDQMAHEMSRRNGMPFGDNAKRFWRYIKPRAGVGGVVTVSNMKVSNYRRLIEEAKRYAREMSIPLLAEQVPLIPDAPPSNMT